METVPMASLIEQLDSPNVFAFARGVLFAAARVKRGELKVMLKELRKQFAESLEAGEMVVRADRTYLTSVEIDSVPREQIQWHLAAISRTIDLARKLIREADELAATAPDFRRFWRGAMRNRFLAQLDELEDVQETFALGLSDEFRKEVCAALEEAGIPLPQAAHGPPVTTVEAS